jgi:hypothetical protein
LKIEVEGAVWEKLQRSQRKDTVAKIDKILHGPHVGKGVDVHICRLPFFKDVDLVWIEGSESIGGSADLDDETLEDKDGENDPALAGELLGFQSSLSEKQDRYFLLLNQVAEDSPSIVSLNGNSAPLHFANEAAQINLTRENVLSYLHFFCYFVHGDDGSFYVLDERIRKLMPAVNRTWRSGESENRLPSIDMIYRPPCLKTTSTADRWFCSALVYYGNDVFIADFAVLAGGEVEMEADEMLLQGLPLHAEIAF